MPDTAAPLDTPGPAGPAGPAGTSLAVRYWPAPAAPPDRAVLAVAGGTGLVAALTAWSDRVGLQPALVALGLTAAAVLAVRRAGRGDGVRASRSRRAFAALAVALAVVPALRDGAPTVVLSLLGALGLAILAATDSRSWPAALLAVPAAAAGAVRAVLWAARAVTGLRPARAPRLPWLRGAAVSLVVGAVLLALLRSADAAFDAAVGAALPTVTVGTLGWRVVVLVVVGVTALTAAFLAVAPPRWDAVRLPRRPGGAAEWALPLALVDALLAAFVAVQAALLFGAYPEALVSGGLTPAERARQGFGQLVAVTLLAVVLLGWAGRRAGDGSRPRRLLLGLGGALVALVLVVVASALRRMALYEQAFGWTVLRIHVAAFEVWLAVVLVLCGLAWLLRRTDLVPRGVLLAAGAGLLALNLAGPDALAARANVERFATAGTVDTEYLARLSDDAVPALARLPEPQRSAVLAGRVAADDPWYAANLARWRAAQVLGD